MFEIRQQIEQYLLSIFDQYLCFDAKPFGRQAHTKVFLRIIFRRFTRGAELAFRCEILSEPRIAGLKTQTYPNWLYYYESNFSTPTYNQSAHT